MSKAKLKKELENFNAEQLRQIILDVYDSSKNAKDYLEFFLNPDIDKLNAKFDTELSKEFRRSKFGTSKARISKIRQMLKNYAAFQPGNTSVLRSMVQALAMGIDYESYLNYPDPLANGLATLMLEYFDSADRWGETELALRNLDILLGEQGYGSKRYRAHLNKLLNEHLLSLGIIREK